MKLGDWFRRLFGRNKEVEDGDIAAPPGADSGLGGPIFEAFQSFVEQGGEHPVQGHLESLRFAAQSEAIALARAGHDPARWANNEFRLDYERGLAHDHEALRSVTLNHATRWLSARLGELHEYARRIVQSRHVLEGVDREFARLHRDWTQSAETLRNDPLEVGRYYRSRPKAINWAKVLIVALFIFTEFVMTGQMIDSTLSQSDSPLPQGFGYVMAFGVMVLLVVVPHYAARGLKEGLTRFHGYEQQYLEEHGEDIPPEMRRSRAHEEQDDRGFRVTAVSVGALLLLLILPLSVLRAKSINQGWMWMVLFLLLQVAVSGYFFLREWYDHGLVSSDHSELTRQYDEISDKRTTHLGLLSQAVRDFNDVGEQYLEVARSASRWDAYIVSTYWSTLRFHRHLISQHNSELAPFVNAAEAPQLARTGETLGNEVFHFTPTTIEHPDLEDLGVERLGEPSPPSESSAPSDTTPMSDVLAINPWSLFALPSPSELLRSTLARNGLTFDYVPPVALSET